MPFAIGFHFQVETNEIIEPKNFSYGLAVRHYVSVSITRPCLFIIPLLYSLKMKGEECRTHLCTHF